MYVLMYIYIYIYIYRERERERYSVYSLLSRTNICKTRVRQSDRSPRKSGSGRLRVSGRPPRKSGGGVQTSFTDGIGTPDPNPKHLVNWCLS